ncbi:MAG: 4-oxalocrotonate tautomerase family protein [Chloroflexi bacterium]|nr:4-oxalocrotonate tautomerase family protein [Chloroflexota bacterium]MCH8116281.1 4-oxalocrotonate tautomerase family protein [Chloroflexota bacterium]MCI0776517.1 4-oxalocrotonate tautomerase family protein [Chloroflexota bacterium]MCI0805196.1 4-oxalocrotonate tautomerase family protein [Chloroflexota bacterium]MCI0808142.1 4-oxalocrotonate tautomerase family protein [Chloroflexota bacterium]
MQEKKVPVVNISLYAGRTDEQKAALAKAVTKAISETVGIPDSATTIIFRDVEKSDWSIGGVMASDS